MSVSRIEQWLSSIGFKQYTQLFIDNGYDDFELCKHLKENDLDLMGITIPIVKAEILSSVNNLKDAPNAAHVYFSMDPNYWQADGTVHSKASTIRNYLREQNDSGIIHENEGNDVYNVVMQELTKDEITPTMLLSFPVTLKSRLAGRDSFLFPCRIRPSILHCYCLYTIPSGVPIDRQGVLSTSKKCEI